MNFRLGVISQCLRARLQQEKTTLYEMVRLAAINGSGVKKTVSRNVDIVTLTSDTWELVLGNIKDTNCIFVLDESCSFMKTIEFARLAKQSGCYFILITREELASIPCSIHEIYELVTVGKTTRFHRCYPTVHYGNIAFSQSVLTEDSNAGFELFYYSYPELHVHSAHGRDSLISCIRSLHKVLVIADGAALGFVMERLLSGLALIDGGAYCGRIF